VTADDFRRLYDYHFYVNRQLWDQGIAPLTAEQFRQPVAYSVGSVRNQVVHMMNMEERWFCGLRGAALPGILNPVYFGTAAKVRARWDAIEADMRATLAALTDETVRRPFDDRLAVWEVLWHVLNHGTDHRAQTMMALAALGATTFPQDYALYRLGKL